MTLMSKRATCVANIRARGQPCLPDHACLQSPCQPQKVIAGRCRHSRNTQNTPEPWSSADAGVSSACLPVYPPVLPHRNAQLQLVQ